MFNYIGIVNPNTPNVNIVNVKLLLLQRGEMGGSESKGSPGPQVFTQTEIQHLHSKFDKLFKSPQSFQVRIIWCLDKAVSRSESLRSADP